jgi:hypothetical protein
MEKRTFFEILTVQNDTRLVWEHVDKNSAHLTAWIERL